MPNTLLETLEQFAMGSNVYYVGTKFPISETEDWPEGTLERRLNNKFVKYVVEEAEAPKKPAKAPKVVAVESE